uniref:Protein misato n=1 Tax=Lygus hesperus TaxID=30085 RepID=A0A146LPX4_LYGHE
MSSVGKEIVSFQFGGFPNFVGAHFFNIQTAGFSFNPDFPADINHDILFKEGKSDSGSFTYTPRLVSVDLEESLHSLSTSGLNFVKPPPTSEVQEVTQAEALEIHQNPQPSKNEYFEDVEKQSKAQDNPNAMQVDLLLKTKYDLTTTVKSWSEVLTVNLHPKSITMIPKTLSSGLDVQKSTFKTGDEIWRNPSFVDNFEDNLRFQLEACDIVQGFHLLTECENMYSGISNGCLDYLRDECGKKSILTVPIFSLYDGEEDGLENRNRVCTNLINTGVCLSRSNELSDLVAPLSTLSELWGDGKEFRDFRNLKYDGSSCYQSTAVMAACLELISTPYRLKRLPDVKMNNITELLDLPGRKLVGAGVVFPFPDLKINYDILELLKRHKYCSLCPFVPLESTLDTQSVTLRGFPHGQFPSSPALFVSSCNVRISRTFPDIIPHEYDLSNSALYYGRLREVSGLSGLCNTREMRVFTDKLVEKLRQINFSKISSFVSSGFERPEFVEMMESVQDISSSYDISMFL